ncbi:MAG: HAMP domain-containing sensor histidine kinase [Bacteroidota bacterium]
MKRRTLSIFLLLALTSIMGIVVIQIYWFSKAYENNEQEFDTNVNIALKEVVKGILKYNNITNIPVDPVKQLKPNYYAVMVNDQINAEVLEHYLQTELKKFNIKQGFEYSIYDCSNKKIMYGGYVDGEGNDAPVDKTNWPQWKADNYYFTVYFPHKTIGIVGQMALWLYSSAIILIIVIFFSYSLFVILKQKRLSEIQRDFINNMAHEIRTPLTTISISAQTLKDPQILDSPQRLLNYSTIIIDEASKLKNHIERVLSIAESESKLKLNLEKFDLHEMIQKISTQLIHNNTHKNIQLHFTPETTHQSIVADKLHIGNMISNIIDNSIKYSATDLTININILYKTPLAISIHFTDDGFGISKENQKKIFDKFYRVPTGNIHNTKGFGIGLNYAILIAKAHKGNITVSSELNKGTTFIVNLPIA